MYKFTRVTIEISNVFVNLDRIAYNEPWVELTKWLPLTQHGTNLYEISNVFVNSDRIAYNEPWVGLTKWLPLPDSWWTGTNLLGLPRRFRMCL